MMKIEMRKVTISGVAKNFRDNDEDGVVGYDGKLNIRPKYQREFVYDAKQRDAVLATIRKGFPLNVMYWAVNEDGTYEVLDGQQRTISFCRYAAGDFSIIIDGHPMTVHNLTQPQKDQILNYQLTVYVGVTRRIELFLEEFVEARDGGFGHVAHRSGAIEDVGDFGQIGIHIGSWLGLGHHLTNRGRTKTVPFKKISPRPFYYTPSPLRQYRSTRPHFSSLIAQKSPFLSSETIVLFLT